MKHCKKCGVHKAEDDFYTRDNTCKACRKAAVRANYSRNKDHYREYERRRSSLPHRVEARNTYARTERGIEKSNAAKRAYRDRNPDKYSAHNKICSALKAGKIWKSPCCMAPDCFSADRLHGHHADYDRPLSVVWLCAACHSRLHEEHRRTQSNAA